MKQTSSSGKLREEVARRTQLAADALLQNDVKAAKENIEWIQTAAALVDKNPGKSSQIKWAIGIGLVSVLLIGLSFSIRTLHTNIAVDLVASSVHFKINQEWVLRNRFSPAKLTITNLREVSARGANMHVAAEQPFALTLQGSQVHINQLVFSPRADITIQLRDSSQHFLVKKDSLVTDVQVSRAHITTDGDPLLDTLVRFDIPELFTIRSFLSVAIPIEIQLKDTTDWVFRDIGISEIDFLEEITPGSGQFVSTIRSGNVKILETDKDTKLEEGDWLVLEELQNRRIQMAKSGSHLRIHIEGEVARARAGSRLFEKTLNPTLLEYLYHAKSLAFFWSAVVFSCSLLWSVRNTLFVS
jgi:hypothetical protein